MKLKYLVTLLILPLLSISAFGQGNTSAYWMEKANKSFQNEAYNESIGYYDKAIGVDPSRAEAWFGKGLAMTYLGRHKEAIELYDNALKINPSYADAWNYKGISLEEEGQYQESLNSINEAISINSSYADAWDNKGITLYYMRKYHEALDCVNRAIELNPKLADAWFNKGVICDALGLEDQANEAYATAKDMGFKGAENCKTRSQDYPQEG